MLECLPNNSEALSSEPSKKNRVRGQRGRVGKDYQGRTRGLPPNPPFLLNLSSLPLSGYASRFIFT
jgi:hypothetical protein